MTEAIALEAISGTLEWPSTTDACAAKVATPIRRFGLGVATMIVPPARDLHPVKALLVDRAYSDFCRRRERGEDPDPDQFCERFPSIRSALIKVMQCHLFLADNPAMAGAEEGAILWPGLGETFLDFDLVQELGCGAFGRVFLATEPKLGNRLVAVKVAKYFGLAEAKLLGRLKHPNIVPIYSLKDDSASGLTAVCMPYVGSATLDDVLDHVFSQPTPKPRAHHILEAARQLKHPLEASAPVREADSILRHGTYVDAIRSLGAQLADALAFIHGLGICHRDLKPSNVLMSPQGVPMLLDFNLSTSAKDVDSLFGGTLPYMSPEQLQGADLDGHAVPVLLDGRSDIFSLGVILFQLLTGRHPYGPVSVQMKARELRQLLLQRHLDGAPSPRRLNPDIDPAFSKLLERCLAYNPNDRPQSAAEIAQALRDGLAPQRRAGRWVSRHPQSVFAGLVLCLSLGLTGAAATVYGPRSERPMDAGVRLFEQKDYVQARDKFNQVIAADRKNAAALIARGQIHQQMAATDKVYWQHALADFVAADDIQRDGRTSACIGYCILKTGGPVEWARQRFQAAIDDRFDGAEVYNNLGYCLQEQHKLADAEKCLDRAIESDPQMQAAYYTRGLVHQSRALDLRAEVFNKEKNGRDDETMRDVDAIRADILKSLDAGIQDIEKAIDFGPANANMHRSVAQLYAEAARHGRDAKDQAFKHLAKAITGGLKAKQLVNDPVFRAFFAPDQIAEFGKIAGPLEPAQPMVRELDPLKGGLHFQEKK